MTGKEVLQKALEILGPNGENWARDAASLSNKKHCAMTACYEAAGVSSGEIPSKETIDSIWQAQTTLMIHLPKSYKQVPPFNDDPQTTFEDIQDLYQRSIQSLAV